MLPGSAVFGLLGAGEGCALDVGVEDDVERLGCGGVEFFVLADADLGEECLVGQAPVLVVAAGVDPSDVGGEGEAVVDVIPSFGVVVAVLGAALVDRGLLGAEPVLELGELLEADCVLQVRFEEPVLFVDVRGPPLGELRGFDPGGFGEAVEFVVEHAAQDIADRGGDLDALVVVDDEVFDVGDADRGLGEAP